MSADSPRRSSGSRGFVAATVPPQVVSDRSILDSAIGFINDVTLTNQPHTDPKDTITWARFETSADISDPRYGDDWELEGNVAPPLLLLLGYGLGVQVWAIPANGEAVEVLSWRHGIVSALRILPTPTTCVTTTTAYETHGRADELIDMYAEKRPLIAIVDGSTSAGSQPQFCAVNFVSLKTGTQVKTIKFKNPVLDILANRTSIVITFHERIAVFDARTLEDRLSITTCFPSPGINPNPVALGPRWLAYAEHKLLHSKRSGGGCDGEGVASYTATVLNAAKSLGKGLRELGEQVAAGLTGTTGSTGTSKNNSFDSQSGIDAKQPGVVTILDIKNPIKDYSPTSGTPMSGQAGTDPIVAHFIAHSEAVVAMDFDNSGMLLVTADRRGHDFHIFRIQPHPVGSSLAAVHHLYVLHRGDTSAKVQNITFSLDARWVAVSTLRGTTHVFPITPYGGPMGVRTHTSLHVVNKLSRFHRSAGLSADGRSSSPISHSESTTFTQSLQPYHNPTLPPFPRPTVVLPLAQLRQPFTLGSPPGSAGLSIGVGGVGGGIGGGGVGNVGLKTGSAGSSSSHRQRLSSLSDDNGKPLSVCAIFAKSRSWLLEPPNVTREAPHRIQRKAVDSLFVMAGHGALIQYDLDTKLASNVAKEKICDDTPIELEVEAKAQWNLGRRREGSQELMPPLSSDNWLIRDRNSCVLTDSTRQFDDADDRAESWLSQVEIITHAGPHRRLWMGPQFVFKTYNAPSGSNLSHVDAEAVEIGVSKATTTTAMARAERSSPLSIAGRSAVPVLIESGSYSSIEQSPKLMDRFRHDHLDSDFSISHGDTRLKEDLADAMRESPSVSSAHKDSATTADGGPISISNLSDNPTFYDALAEHEPHEHETSSTTTIYGSHDSLHYVEQTSFDANRPHQHSSSSMASAVALASVLPNISSYDTSSGYESFDSFRKPKPNPPSIEKIVNPFGTVTTITAGMTADVKTDMLDEVVSKLASEECVIHENCDEALFRPVVAIFCDENERKRGEEEAKRNEKYRQPPEMIDNKLIVPVIAKEVDAELSKKEKQKNVAKLKQQQQQQQNKAAEKSAATTTTNEQEKEKETSKKEELLGFDKLSDKSGGAVGKTKVKPVPAARVVKASTITTTTATTPTEKEYKVKVLETEATRNSKKEIKDEMKQKSDAVSSSKTTQKKQENIKNDKNETTANAKIAKKTSTKEETTEEKDFELLNVKNSKKRGEIKTVILNAVDLADSLIEDKEQFEDDGEEENKEVKKVVEEEEEEEKLETKKTELESEKKTTKKVEIQATKAAKKGAEKTEEVSKEKETKEETTKVETKEEKVSKTSAKNKQQQKDVENEEISIKEIVKQKQDDEKEKVLTKGKKVEKEKLEEKKQLEEPEAVKKDVKQTAKKEAGKADETKSLKETVKSEEKSEDKISSKATNKTEKEENIKPLKEALKIEATPKEEPKEKIELSLNTAATIISGDGGKTAKKKKKSQSRSSSNSNSEAEEVIEVTTTQKSKKTKQKERRNSQSSEGSCAELEQVIVEPANKKNESMFLSFLQTEEKKNKKSEREKENDKEIAEITAKIEETNKFEVPKKEEDNLREIKVISDKKVPTKIIGKNNYKEETASVESKVEESPKKEINKGAIKKETPKVEEKVTKIKSELPELPPRTPPRSPKKKVNETTDKENVYGNNTVSGGSVPGSPVKVITQQPTKSKNEMATFQTAKNEAYSSTTVSTKAAETVGDVTDSPQKTKPAIPKNSPQKNSPTVTSPPPIPTSPWKTLSGADLIQKNLESLTQKSDSFNFPNLASKNTSKSTASEKLILDLPTPVSTIKSTAGASTTTSNKSTPSKKSNKTSLDDFPLLNSLNTLPPLPSLEPLEVPKSSKEAASEQVSLITFESPHQEHKNLERKVIPPLRGGPTEQTLVYALCGSLHYAEDEHGETTKAMENDDDDDLTMPSLPDLDDDESPFTTAAAFDIVRPQKKTTNYAEKYLSSSPCSSASEEIIVLEEKKMSKKQKRKRQQQLQEKHQQQQQENSEETQISRRSIEVDEELRPLIDSQIYMETMTSSEHFGSLSNVVSSSTTAAVASASKFLEIPTSSTTTTDSSEGPMPATTSDDNVFVMPTAKTSPAPNKVKTKKLEHKFNLFAAIEAATSTSNSSAEESSVEGGGGRASDHETSTHHLHHHHHHLHHHTPLSSSSIIGSTSTATGSAMLTLPPSLSVSAQLSATKKKTKRRKR